MLEIKNITKYYKNHLALAEVSFSVSEGEILALLGANGAGKSTALKCLIGLMDPDLGEILIDQEKMSCDDRIKIIHKIGYLNCEMGMYDKLTLKENYFYFARLRGLKKLEIENRLSILDKTLDLSPILHKKFQELSSGQKQKSLLALSVIHDPKYLIFDEITASLDVVTCKMIYDFILSEKKRGKGIIFATHIMHEVEILSDKIAILEAGRVAALTDLATIKSEQSTDNLFHAFYHILEKHKRAA
jgi:sodium transport system ATP-binding protein